MTKGADNDGQLKALLCFNVYALNRSFGRFYQSAFSETGLTYPKFVILMALKEEGPMSVSTLSLRAGVEPNTLSPIVKKMAGFDLISRQRANDDERRVELEITAKGEAVLQRAQEVVYEGFASLNLEGNSLADAIAFLETTREVVDDANPPKLNLDGIR
ncbi:MAG: MarR family transcriptional regulator [Pseudomonadota bacterium]